AAARARSEPQPVHSAVARLRARLSGRRLGGYRHADTRDVRFGGMFICTECGDAQTQAGFCPADGAALAPVGDDPLLGTTVGVYRVARLIGRGGMGRVYKGVHPSIGSRVAIKVLSRESSDRPDLVD